jgi:hypothetical protein
MVALDDRHARSVHNALGLAAQVGCNGPE